MKDELLAEGAQVTPEEFKTPVSEPWFLQVLDEHYEIVIHRHKRFAQCMLCFMLKQLAARAACPADRDHIKKHRGLHYKTVRLERIEYHTNRRNAQLEPARVMSIIIDAMTKWKTALPLFSRELKFGKFKAYGQQLYGVLVHQDVRDEEYHGGFFGYLVDSTVHGGGSLTVELLYRTLQRLQDGNHRKTWPQELDIQLDNTCSDNKNDTVLGFCAYLVATGTFKKVVLTFLPVGHTHEDIDAVFGVLMRYLTKIGAVQTISKLMDCIWNCLTNDSNNELATSWKPSAELQRIQATHDWDAWLKKACSEARECNLANGRKKKAKPLRKIKHYALTTGSKACADNRRPHRFEFTLEGPDDAAHVVMRYYHWAHDTEPWSGSIPIPMMNYVPDLNWLKPAKLNMSVIDAVQQCATAVAAGSAPCKQCSRCDIQPVFENSTKGYRAEDVFTATDKAEWDNLFADLTVENAHASLPHLRPLPKAPTARNQARTFSVPLACEHPEARLPPPIEHSPQDIELHALMQAYKRQPATVQGRTSISNGSNGTQTGVVDNVVGARRDPKTGKVEVAIVWVSDNPPSGGTWESIDILNLRSPEELATVTSEDGPTDAEFEGHAQWNEHFGPDVAAGTEVIVIWNQGSSGKQKTRQAFLGRVGNNYDEPMHLINTPKQNDDATLGTRRSVEEEYYMDMSNLATDYSSSRVDSTGDMATTYLEAWVFLEYWQHPFIQEYLYPTKNTSKKQKKRHMEQGAEPEAVYMLPTLPDADIVHCAGRP